MENNKMYSKKRLSKLKEESNEKYYFDKIVDLKLLCLTLGLKIEGIEKCFKEAGNNAVKRNRCTESLPGIWGVRYLDTFEKMLKIKDEISSKNSLELKNSMINFFSKFGSLRDISEEKITEARELLCNILTVIQKELE